MIPRDTKEAAAPVSLSTAGERRRRWRPDHVLPPGHLLRDELNSRGISQAELAVRTGFTPKHINQVINGVVPLSADVALVLERVLDVPSYVWNSMEAEYRDAHVRTNAQDVFRKFIEWAHRFPIRDLVGHGILTPGDDGTILVEKVLSFFGVADPDAFDILWSEPTAAFRRFTHYPVDLYATATWLRLAEIKAATISLQPFDGKAFMSVLPGLRELTRLPLPDAFPDLQRRCAAAGVAVARIPEITGTRACGATRWINSAYPIIVLSGRYKTEDSIWFSFFHEAGHVIRHPKKMTYIKPDSRTAEDDLEVEADRFAADTLIAPDVATQLGNIHTTQEIIEFADRIGVDPGIVAGRLSNDQMMTWQATRKLRKPCS